MYDKTNILHVALIFWVFPSCFCFSGPQGHDDEGSSTSEDEGYPEDMDQDKHDDTSDDSDSDRSDVDSEGEELLHHEDGAEREGGEDKKLGQWFWKMGLCWQIALSSSLIFVLLAVPRTALCLSRPWRTSIEWELTVRISMTDFLCRMPFSSLL